MTKAHSTNPPTAKPPKPRSDFPLFAHASGRWCKKIAGRHRYFGPWSDPQGAEERYEAEKDDLRAGRSTRGNRESLTLSVLCARFMERKKDLLDAGELSANTFREYTITCNRVLDEWCGKKSEKTKKRPRNPPVSTLSPDHFANLRAKWAKLWGPIRLGNEINRVRSIFKFAAANVLIERPVMFGDGFARPSAKTLLLDRAAKGPRMFQAAEVRRLLAAAGQPLKAMIMLGANCGYGNEDLGRLPMTALDLDNGWSVFPRPKTGVKRRAKLWPETVAALREWLDVRPTPASDEFAGLVFLTVRGSSWAKTYSSDNPLAKEFAKLAKEVKLAGRGFYGLRHGFQQIADEGGDFPCVTSVMGHKDTSMPARYRGQFPSDKRLEAVANHVRNWLFDK